MECIGQCTILHILGFHLGDATKSIRSTVVCSNPWNALVSVQFYIYGVLSLKTLQEVSDQCRRGDGWEGGAQGVDLTHGMHWSVSNRIYRMTPKGPLVSVQSHIPGDSQRSIGQCPIAYTG